MSENNSNSKVFFIDEVWLKIIEVEVIKETQKVYQVATDIGVKNIKRENIFLNFSEAQMVVLKKLEAQKNKLLKQVSDLDQKMNYIKESSSFKEMSEKRKKLISKQ